MTSGDSAPDSPTRASVIPLLPVWRVDRRFDYLVPAKLGGKLAIGSLVRVPFGNRKVRGIVVDVGPYERGKRDLEEIASLVVDAPLAPPPMHELLDWMARRYVVARGVAFARVVPPRVRVANLSVRSTVGVPNAEPGGLLRSYSGGSELIEAVSSGSAGVWSLQSLPGHDHGELISELVAAVPPGGGALVTVPEVRFGSPVLDGIEKRWPDLARVDSAQDDAERARSWLSLASGHALAAGGRSALLAPMPNLKLIVVDEEHHTSYKEDRSPRYHARRLAVERARRQQAICVLVSATPSLDTSFRVGRSEWPAVRPGRNELRAARPIVEVVPLPIDRALGAELHSRMRDVLRAGRRVGLLAPARGYARSLWCTSCRRSLRCPVCEAGLFYDHNGVVRCARCGFENKAPDVCPTCGSSEWRYLGAGSERLETQVAKAFPRSKVRRVDPSTLGDSSRDSSDADIYLTTWVGTKAALRPDVGLVGVLNVDALIRRAEWRSSEDAYQALAEMSQWAGPASQGGRLLLQTSDPGHHSVQAVVRADHGYFVTREIEMRKDLAYPPWQELLTVTASGPEANTAIEDARAAVGTVTGEVRGPILVRRTTPDEAFVDLRIQIKCRDATEVAERLRELFAVSPAGSLKIDVDPL